MKRRFRDFIIKLFSLILVVILAIPSQIFAAAATSKDQKVTYDETSSIMDLPAETTASDPKSPEDEEKTILESETTRDETEDFIIEKSATLDKEKNEIAYRIALINKNQTKKDPAIDQEFLTTAFAVNINSSRRDIKVEEVKQIDESGKEINIEHSLSRPGILENNVNIQTAAIKTIKPEKGLVYYLTSEIEKDAFDQDKDPIFSLDLVSLDTDQEAIYQNRYSLSLNDKKDEISLDEEGNIIANTADLVEVADASHMVDGLYVEKIESIFNTVPANIKWSDYIFRENADKFRYEINLDEEQITDNSEIKVEFYEARDNGFVINNSFSQKIPFTNYLDLSIPEGQFARVEFTTNVDSNKTIEAYSFNGKTIKNPIYEDQSKTEENKETESKEDADPLPANTEKSEKPATEAENQETDTGLSAIALNKDAYIEKLKDESKLTENIEKSTEEIASILEAYNKKEITYEDFKKLVGNIATTQDIDANTTEEILAGLVSGLNAEKYPVANIDTKDAAGLVETTEETPETEEITEEEASEASQTEEGAELPAEDILSVDEIKVLIKEEFAKEKSGQISEDELETSLEKIRDENNIEKEDFFNILADLYQNEDLTSTDPENPSQAEELPAIDTEKSKEDVLVEKLAEENLSTEDFIAFLQSYAKSYDLEEDDLQAILMDKQDEVKKVIGDFTIYEIVAAAYHEGLNPLVLAADENANTPTIDFSNEKFMTELEYKTVTLSDENNIEILKEIVKKFDPVSSDQQITDAYVGWRINLPGSDPTGWDLQELKSEKYNFQNLGISIYAPDDQGLRNYYVRITEAGSGRVISSGYMKQNGSHLSYGTDILKANLPSDGINIDVVAEAPVKRQSYTIGLRVTPDNNYISDLADKFKEKYEELKQKYPLLIKWMDTGQADVFKPGLNLVDTRMVYLEPDTLQDKTPYTPYISKEYTDNNMDTDTGIGKNTFTMFGNLDDGGNLEWTISETMTLEKLYGDKAGEIGNSAYSVSGYGIPNVEILVPNGSGYTRESLGPIDQNTLQSKLVNAVPGTIVNYTYTKEVDNPGEDQKVTINHFGSQEVSIKLKEVFDGENDPSLENYDNSKLDQQPNGIGYEVALREPDFMWAFKPLEPSKNPRNKDKGIDLNGVLAYCINMGKKYPTRSNGFNKTMTKVPLTSNDGNKITEKLNNPRLTGTPSTPTNVMENIRKVFWYADQMQREYDFDTKTFYRIVQYNVFYYTSTDAEQYAYQFGQDMLPGAIRTYAEELKNRVAAGKGWDQVSEDQVHVYMYEHSDRSRQTVIAGDVHAKDKAKVGRLEVRKYDSTTNDNLYGAIFELRKSNNEVIGRASTDSKGIARFDNIPVGTGYKLVEVKAPAGYIKDTKERTINITDFATTQVPVRENVPNTKPEIELIKVDEKSQPIDGVSFILRRNGLDVVNSTVVSKDGGKFGWYDGLTPGSYEVIEVDLPTGYDNYSDNKGKVVYRFKVDANNQIVENSKENLTNEKKTSNVIVNKKDKPKKGQIEFTKKDSDSEKVLQGAEFVLEYKKEGSTNFRELAGSRKTTDAKGKISWKDLEAGDYRVIETKTPGKGYETDINLGEKATFTVSSDGKTHTVTDVNPSNKVITNVTKPEEGKGAFEFEKIDEDTNEKLAGVEFTLTSEGQVYDGNKYFDYKASKLTDVNGKIRFDKLLPGTYILKETKPLAGYEANTNTWKVVVSKNNETRVFDDRGKDITKSNASKIEAGDGKGPIEIKVDFTTLGSIKSSIKPTDKPNIFDLDLTITPESDPFSKRVNIYYIYDNDADLPKIKDLVNRVDIKGKSVIKKGIKVTDNNDLDDSNRYTNQFTEIKQLIGTSYKTTPTIVLSVFSNSYNIIDFTDNYNMTQGRNELALLGIPIFAYHRQKVTDQYQIDKVYNRNIYHFEENYKNNDFSEVLDYINGGKSRLEGKTIQLTAQDGMTLDNDLKSKTINGSNLVAKKENTITTKINITNAENFPRYTPALRSLQLDRDDLSGAIPSLIFNTATGSDNTSGQGDSDGANTSSAPAVMASPITNKKVKPEPANLTIKKVDSGTNEALEGAKFELYQYYVDAVNGNNKITEATTNEFGYAVFEDSTKIKAGEWYFVKEVQAPLGYKISGDGITQVKASSEANNEIDIEIANDKINVRFEIYKKDKEGNYLEGATFRLLDENQKQLSPDKVATTDKNGYALFDNLEAGKIYYLEELEAPEGYLKNPTKLKLEVETDGNIKWEKNNLVEEEYNEPEYITKQRPLEKWRAFEDNILSDDPSYLNTREYAELINPETGEQHYYVMLKAQDFEGNGTNVATDFIAMTVNADIKKIEIFEANFYDSNIKKAVAHDMKEGIIADNKDLFLANAPNTNAGDITMESAGISARTTNKLEFENSANEATIRFPNGRFDGNWAYVVKVTAKVKDTSQSSKLAYRWQNSFGEGKYLANYQEMPPLISEVKIRQSDTSRFTVINEKRPSINFVKEDVASGEKLYGAQFVLYKGDDEVEDSLTSSDKDGKFAFNELEDGSYTVYETSAPDGYPYLEDKENVASFEVSDGKITSLKTNPDYGNTETSEFDSNKNYIIYNKVNEIKFRKVGEDGKALAGGQFEIRKVSSSENEKNATVENSEKSANEKGELVWSIKEPGRYQVVETEAPTDYKEVGQDGLVVAEFTVAKETLDITNILVGDKFYPDTEAKEFPADGFVNIENKKRGEGSFELIKTDMGDSSTALENAKFLLQDKSTGTYIMADGSQENELGKAIEKTNASGNISYTGLSNGTYTLKEYDAPDGYIKSKNVWEVKVQDSTTTISLDTTVEESESVIKGSNLTVKNRGNKITFEKQDKEDPNKKLKDAEFMIYREEDYTSFEGNTSYELYKDANGNTTFKTDEDGKIVLENLKMGHYKVYETKAPDGYYVEDDLADDNNRNMDSLPADAKYVANFYVDINGYIKADKDDTGQTTELTKVITNTAYKGKFKLLKVDSNDKPIRLAQFTLIEDGVKEGEGYKYEGTSTSEGSIEFINLTPNKTYTLKETKAPDGYIATDQEWKVVVDQAGKVSIQAKNGSTDGSIVEETDDINNLSDENKKKLNANGYLILNATGHKDTTIKILNRKPSMPQTGGSGVFKGFAILGTAVMILALAYFGLSENKRSRFRR